MSAHPTHTTCRETMTAKIDEMLEPVPDASFKDAWTIKTTRERSGANGFLQHREKTAKGIKEISHTNIRYLCLPDTLDPRTGTGK